MLGTYCIFQQILFVTAACVTQNVLVYSDNLCYNLFLFLFCTFVFYVYFFFQLYFFNVCFLCEDKKKENDEDVP